MSTSSPLKSREKAAEYLGISTRALDRLRETRLAWVEIDGRVLIQQSVLDAYIASQTVTPEPAKAKPAVRSHKKRKPASTTRTGSDFADWFKQQNEAARRAKPPRHRGPTDKDEHSGASS